MGKENTYIIKLQTNYAWKDHTNYEQGWISINAKKATANAMKGYAREL
jgi:hypothetical protein